jgi:peptidoglycan hydrolase-like protein with peptidoglycan-binding domain
MFRFGDDDDYTTLDNAPGTSGWFDLGDTVGLGRANRRHDMLKVETLLANAGDLDLSKTGGAMGYGLYTVDDAVRKFQGRNGLKVDGWLRPDGPTIAKLKDQLGGVLGGYPAPTPEQVDLHHRLRNRGEEGLLAVEPPSYKLLPNPSLPPVDRRTRGSNESWVNWTARNRSDLSGASEMLTTYIKNFGDDGIVQARDFVEQWDQIKPGQGSDAIRQILALVADPSHRERFLGGRLPQMPPYGVLKPGAEQRIAALKGGTANNIVADKNADDPELVYDPISNTYVWKPQKPEDILELHAVGDDPARKFASASENAEPEQGIQVAQNGSTLSDINGDDSAEGSVSGDAQEARARNEAHHDRFFEKYTPIAEKLGEELGVPKEWVLALISRENGWEKDGPNPQNNPFGMMTPSGKKQYDSLDAAVEDWKNTWGPRVKNSVDFEDFIKGLQTRGRWPYNSEESETKLDRKGDRPPYEQMLRDQYKSIQNRFSEWQTKRKPTL